MNQQQILDNVQASIRNNLGKLADHMLGAKVIIAEKLRNEILEERDPVKRQELQTKMAEIILSEKEIEKLDQVFEKWSTLVLKMLDFYEKALEKFLKMRTAWKAQYKE